MANQQNRRTAIKNIVTGTVAIGATASLASFKDVETKNNTYPQLKGNINQSVCRWCFKTMTMDELCKAAKDMGLKGIDLIGPPDWPIAKKYGLYSSMCNGADIGIPDGFNDKQFHEKLIKNYTEVIPLVAEAGYSKLICFSGSRRGKDDETGWNNCVEGLKPLISLAEKHNVILTMELLNSKIDHKDYQCNKTAWGVELVKRIGSDHFKLLYDIYHMQIDEGDVIRTIEENHQYFAHYHTAGVPGRHEIDETQELNYPAIMRAILKTGYTGFVGQEFLPLQTDKMAALRQGVVICDV